MKRRIFAFCIALVVILSFSITALGAGVGVENSDDLRYKALYNVDSLRILQEYRDDYNDSTLNQWVFDYPNFLPEGFVNKDYHESFRDGGTISTITSWKFVKIEGYSERLDNLANGYGNVSGRMDEYDYGFKLYVSSTQLTNEDDVIDYAFEVDTIELRHVTSANSNYRLELYGGENLYLSQNGDQTVYLYIVTDYSNKQALIEHIWSLTNAPTANYGMTELLPILIDMPKTTPDYETFYQEQGIEYSILGRSYPQGIEFPDIMFVEYKISIPLTNEFVSRQRISPIDEPSYVRYSLNVNLTTLTDNYMSQEYGQYVPQIKIDNEYVKRTYITTNVQYTYPSAQVIDNEYYLMLNSRNAVNIIENPTGYVNLYKKLNDVVTDTIIDDKIVQANQTSNMYIELAINDFKAEETIDIYLNVPYTEDVSMDTFQFLNDYFDLEDPLFRPSIPNVELPDESFFSWIANGVGNFFNAELFWGVSLGEMLWFVIGISTFIIVLKVFAGG